MTGVPSIVMGIFIYTLWVVELGQGRSALAASLALACLMLPIVVRSSEEMLRLVPNNLRRAPVRRPDLKTTSGGAPAAPAVSGAMLAVARCRRDRTGAVHDRRRESGRTPRPSPGEHHASFGSTTSSPTAGRSRRRWLGSTLTSSS
jgi:hypothetical protein